MCPSCPLQILWIVHTVVIKLDLPYPKVMREKPHPEKLRDPTQVTSLDPLQQFPHLQSTSCQRTPPLLPQCPSQAHLPHFTCIHLHIHTPGFQSNQHVHKPEFCTETPT